MIKALSAIAIVGILISLQDFNQVENYGSDSSSPDQVYKNIFNWATLPDKHSLIQTIMVKAEPTSTENPLASIFFCSRFPGSGSGLLDLSAKNPFFAYDISDFTSVQNLEKILCHDTINGFSPNSVILAMIYAPGWNTDPNKRDSIGNVEEHPITIHTDESRVKLIGTNFDFVLNRVGTCSGFKEIGTDTGIFGGGIVLTGFPKDIDGDGKLDTSGLTFCGTGNSYGENTLAAYVKTSNQGGITLSWEGIEDNVIIKTAQYSYRPATIKFSQPIYELNDTGEVILEDLDLRLGLYNIRPWQVTVWSDTDHDGIQLKVHGNWNRTLTDVFNDDYIGKFNFETHHDSRDNSKLRVTSGDNIYVKFRDHTLPPPYDETTDYIDVESMARIVHSLHNIDGIELVSLVLKNTLGKEKNQWQAGETVQIDSVIKSYNQNAKDISYIIQIKEEEGVVQDIKWSALQLKPKHITNFSTTWTATKEGVYIIEVYLWDNFIQQTALTEKHETVTIRVEK